MGTQVLEEREHAKLSPSGASRWMTCTPSAVLESKFKDNTSAAAEEGTLAHLLGETILKEHLGLISHVKAASTFATIQLDDMYNTDMQQHAENYADLILSHVSKDSHVFIETRVDVTSFVPEGFGTADAIIITGRLLDFWDLKYGKGVFVSAVNNTQLKLYALGALNDFGHVFDIATVRMNIYQPRLDNHSVWEISVKELLHWAETELKPKAALAFVGEGEQVAGEHCRFCKAKAKCRKLAEVNLELAKKEFADPHLLSDSEVAQILDQKDLLTLWVNAVTDYAFAQALNGKQWKGYKLVEGRSNRQYRDEKRTELLLIDQGFRDKIYTPSKLLGITALEKAIGNKNFTTFVSHALVKPPGKPTLVKDSDPRPEYNSAAMAFGQE